ncbi:MAG: hypothetical protein SPE49_01590, partial [Campylobacter sp.]|nr:hypothetical protein [Campylobacter sp.]
MCKNITLNEVKNRAFLDKQSYESFPDSSKEIITSPDTNSTKFIYQTTNSNKGTYQIKIKDIAMKAPDTNSSKFSYQITNSSKGTCQISSKEIITNLATNSSSIDQISSKDIDMTAFSGNMALAEQGGKKISIGDALMAALSGNTAFFGASIEQGLNYHGEKPHIGKFFGKPFAVIDAFISGTVYKHNNPGKSNIDVVGTAITAYAYSEAFGKFGGAIGKIAGKHLLKVPFGDKIGEAIGTVIFATAGAIIGSIYASDTYDALKSFYDKLVANLGDFVVNGHSLGGDTVNISLFDPIALDLNNNGKIDTLSLENGVFFDHNGDKVAFKSSWVSSSDGILVRDIDGDGKITSGAELFGNFTRLKNGELAKNGAQALKDLDDNNDGILYSNDKAFNEILIWQDINSDGISQKNELKTLKEHNIKSIDLEFLDDNKALDKDNKQILIGSFSRNIINESKGNLASDIDFSVDTIQRKILDDTDGIIKGTGFVRNFNLSLND